jgi:hypothetical protein
VNVTVHGLTFTADRREIEQAVRAYVPFYNGGQNG